MTPNRVYPGGTWACVWLTMSDDVFLLPTVFLACSSTVFLHTFIPSNNLIMCLLWWGDYVWWCLQPPLRSEKACACFMTLACVTMTDQNIIPETLEEKQSHSSRENLFWNMFISYIIKVKPNANVWHKWQGDDVHSDQRCHVQNQGCAKCLHQCEHV